MTKTQLRWLAALAALAALVAALAAPAVARAQDYDTVRARAHYKAAQELYGAGKYTEAIDRLRQAYAIKPHPTVLRQIGHCYKALGDADGALANYKQYLDDAPDAPDRPDIENAIRELEDIKKEQEGGGVAPVPAPEAEDEGAAPAEENPLEQALRERRRERAAEEGEEGEEEDTGPGPWKWMKWTALGVGGAAVIVAFVFRSKASAAAQALEDSACSDAETEQDRMRPPDEQQCVYGEEDFNNERDIDKFNKLFGVTLGVGLAAMAAGGLFFYLDHRASVAKEVEVEEASIRFVPSVAPGVAGFIGEVQF